MLFQMVLQPVDAVVKFMMNAVSRRFEWEADRFACELDDQKVSASADGEGRMSERLGRALIGLHVENLATVWVDWM